MVLTVTHPYIGGTIPEQSFRRVDHHGRHNLSTTPAITAIPLLAARPSEFAIQYLQTNRRGVQLQVVKASLVVHKTIWLHSITGDQRFHEQCSLGKQC